MVTAPILAASLGVALGLVLARAVDTVFLALVAVALIGGLAWLFRSATHRRRAVGRKADGGPLCQGADA